MGTKTKITLAASFVGVVAMAATAFGQQSTPTPGAEGNRPRAERRTDDNGCGPERASRRARRVVHSEAKVRVPDGFALVTVDQGKVTAVGDDSITIERADGEKVTATTTDETKICKDGQPSSLDKIEVGDHARLVQVRSERFNGLRRIAVLSPGSEPAPEERPARGAPSAERGAPGRTVPAETDLDLALDEAF